MKASENGSAKPRMIQLQCARAQLPTGVTKAPIDGAGNRSRDAHLDAGESNGRIRYADLGWSANRLQKTAGPPGPCRRDAGRTTENWSVRARHTAVTRTTAEGHGGSTHRAVAHATHRSAHHVGFPVRLSGAMSAPRTGHLAAAGVETVAAGREECQALPRFRTRPRFWLDAHPSPCFMLEKRRPVRPHPDDREFPWQVSDSGSSPGCSKGRPPRSGTTPRSSRYCSPSAWASTRRGWPSTTSTPTRAGCRPRSSCSATSPHGPAASGSRPA